MPYLTLPPLLAMVTIVMRPARNRLPLRRALLAAGVLVAMVTANIHLMGQEGYFTPPPLPSYEAAALPAADSRSPFGSFNGAPPADAGEDAFSPASVALQEMGGTIEERLAAIEEAMAKDEAAAQKKKDDDAARPSVKIAARIHTDWWTFPSVDEGPGQLESPDGDPEDRFLFRRIRIGIGGDIPDNMTYKMDIDFNNPSVPQLKDVYFGWEELYLMQTVLIGHQKRPYGLDHLNSSNSNIFMERPLIVEAVNQDARRWGICDYGVSQDERFNWRFGFFMGFDMQSVGVAQATDGTEDYQGELAGRFAHTFWYDESSDGRGYGHWAVSGTLASTDGNAGSRSTARFRTRDEARTTSRWVDTGVILGADDYQMLGLEGVLNWGSLQFASEYQQVWLNRNPGDQLYFHGAYAYVAWVLTGEHHPWDRQQGILRGLKPFENFWLVDTCDDGVAAGWGAWEVALRYSYGDFSDEDIFGGLSRQTTLGLQWHWNQWSRLQFNYIYGNMAERFEDNDPAEPRNGNYHIIGTRFICYF